jgi:hypothetical protein
MRSTNYTNICVNPILLTLWHDDLVLDVHLSPILTKRLNSIYKSIKGLKLHRANINSVNNASLGKLAFSNKKYGKLTIALQGYQSLP